MVVDPGNGMWVWVLTPGRSVEKMALSGKNLIAVKIWDGLTLPASVLRKNAGLAVDTAKGDFTPAEITEAIRQVALVDPATAVGTRIHLGASSPKKPAPTRRVR